MRKRLILIICLSLLSCLIVFSACNKDKNYQTKVYEYIPYYKSTTCIVKHPPKCHLQLTMVFYLYSQAPAKVPFTVNNGFLLV